MKISMKGLSVTQLLDEGRLLRRAVRAAILLSRAAEQLGIVTSRTRRRKRRKQRKAKTAVAAGAKKVKTHLGKAKPEKPKKRHTSEDE